MTRESTTFILKFSNEVLSLPVTCMHMEQSGICITILKPTNTRANSRHCPKQRGQGKGMFLQTVMEPNFILLERSAILDNVKLVNDFFCQG